MDVKALLSKISTTYLAVIVAGVMSIGRMAGVDLVEQDVANVVTLAALAWILLGRAKAPGQMKWWTKLFGDKTDKSGQGGFAARSLPHALLMGGVGASLIFALMATGCATTQVNPNYMLYEMADTYMDLHQDYVTAYDASDASGRQMMRENIAPAMDKAKRVLDAALTVAILGGDVEGENLPEVKAALTEAALALAEFIATEGK